METGFDRLGAFIHFCQVPPTAKGNLSGLTAGVKDLIDVKGVVSGGGNPDWARTHEPAERHAAVVEMLLANGAALAGKTHTDELAYSLLGINHHYGTPVNSAAPARIPGGSSSGSAAAVAAGLVDIGLGTDTGGSIRIPASFCGLYGLRTSHGLIPMRGVMPLAPSFDSVGWLVKKLKVLSMLVDLHCLPQTASLDNAEFIVVDDVWSKAGPGVVAALEKHLVKVGLKPNMCRSGSLSDGRLDHWREVFQVCQAAEIWQCYGAWIERENPSFGPGVRERFMKAAGITTRQWNAAKAERAVIKARMAEILNGKIAIVPAAPSPAPLRDASLEDLDTFRNRALEMLCPAGLAGCPQVVLPAVMVEDAPVGISLIGAHGRDRSIVEAAALFEGASHG